VRGLARALLSGERVALNLLQRLSGVATLTRHFVREVAGTGAQILDTRKTTPDFARWKNMRSASAEAAITARIWRKRFSLRRITYGWRRSFPGATRGAACQGPRRVDRNRSDEFRRVARGTRARPDVILLDNMSPALVRQAWKG